MKIIQGDLLESDCQIIVQQTNCLAVKPHGLSKQIASKFPYADLYKQRRRVGKRNMAIPEDHSQPGTIEISKPLIYPTNQPIVVHLHGQYMYGKPDDPKYRHLSPLNYVENSQVRINWFKEALDQFLDFLKKNYHKEEKIKIGFPYKIGCGLAGGNWQSYYSLIFEFEQQLLGVLPNFELFLFYKG